MKVEKARVGDAREMHRLINYFADKGEMLARPLSEVYENIRDYFVVREGDRLVGCVALHVSWADLAEIKSLAVAEQQQDKGIGAALVKACLEEAANMDIPTIFCLTYKPRFFGQLGFYQVDMVELPRKVWGECQRCPKYPDCDEIALVYELKPKKT